MSEVIYDRTTTTKELIADLQEDLKNERKHLGFYTQSAVMLKGLHREELRKFCEMEASEELTHVKEFSELIVHLGGTPGTDVNEFPSLSSVEEIVDYIIEMENEVANNYANRISGMEDLKNATGVYVADFYTRQLSDSWRTAREVEQMKV